MKIKFSGAGIVEMSGKAQGTIIQKSYGGFQLRKLTLPNKRRSNASQAHRQIFANVNSSWKSLTNVERQTWIDNAPEGISGFEFYSSFNIAQVGAGGIILPSFVAPVANPNPTLADFYVADFENIPPVVVQSFIHQSGNNSIPIGDWLPSFLWTGWIPASRYSYPRINRALSTELSPPEAPSYTVYWGTEAMMNQRAPAVGFKCKYTERWINSTTGQVYTGETFEITWGDDYSIGRTFDPGPQLVSAVLTGTPGNYNLETEWTPLGVDYDTAVWEPYFFMTPWGSSPDIFSVPMTIAIPLTAINITSPTAMTITFSDTAGDAVPPDTAGLFTYIAFNWKKIVGGLTSSGSYGLLEAVDFP